MRTVSQGKEVTSMILDSWNNSEGTSITCLLQIVFLLFLASNKVILILNNFLIQVRPNAFPEDFSNHCRQEQPFPVLILSLCYTHGHILLETIKYNSNCIYEFLCKYWGYQKCLACCSAFISPVNSNKYVNSTRIFTLNKRQQFLLILKFTWPVY